MAGKMVTAQQEVMKLRKEMKGITTQLDNAGEERKRLKDKIKVPGRNEEEATETRSMRGEGRE